MIEENVAGLTKQDTDRSRKKDRERVQVEVYKWRRERLTCVSGGDFPDCFVCDVLYFGCTVCVDYYGVVWRYCVYVCVSDFVISVCI